MIDPFFNAMEQDLIRKGLIDAYLFLFDATPLDPDLESRRTTERYLSKLEDLLRDHWDIDVLSLAQETARIRVEDYWEEHGQ